MSKKLRFKTIEDKSYPDGLFLTEEVRDEWLSYLEKAISKNSKAILEKGSIYIPYHTLAKKCFFYIKNAKKINDKYFITYHTWWNFNEIECYYC